MPDWLRQLIPAPLPITIFLLYALPQFKCPTLKNGDKQEKWGSELENKGETMGKQKTEGNCINISVHLLFMNIDIIAKHVLIWGPKF